MINRKSLEKIIYIVVMSLIIGLPLLKLTSYSLYFSNVIKNSFDFPHVYLLWFSIIPLGVIYIAGIKEKIFKANYIDYIFYILILYAFISTIFAVDIKLSIFGEFHRNEGIISIISYYLIFLCSKNIDNKTYIKNIINTLFLVGIFQVLYGILQVYTTLPFIKHFSYSYMAHSLCGNPNFFGSYILMLLIISTSCYLLGGKIKYLIYTIIYFIGLVLASSTGPFLTFIIILVFMIILLLLRNKTKFKYILSLIVLIPIFYLINYGISLKYKSQVIDQYNIKSDIENIASVSNGRIEIWKNSLPLIKKYYLVGAGLDNFAEVYEHHTLEIRYDKAHNVYLQIAITNGIIPLILTLVIYFIIFIKGFKLNDNVLISIYFSVIAYMIQAFANISVIDVAPIFYILLGISANSIKSNIK